MSKSKLHSPIRRSGIALMLTGLLVSVIGSQMDMTASLSGQGVILGQTAIGEPMWIQAETVLPAAMETQGVGVMALGMLMVLTGFGLHALWILRCREADRTVPVKAAKKMPRTSRKQMEVIWVERTIRF